jgi:hypothetical protein
MKSIIFLSHLHDEHERGGAYLRNSALLSCFESWGIKVTSFYRSQFSLCNQRVKKFLMGLRFGKEIRSLFTKSSFNVPECDALVIDTFKYFSWSFSFEGKKPVLIYNAHNLEFENHFGKEPSSKKAAFARYEAQRLEEMDIILVCSEREQEILVRLNEHLAPKIFVFPNLVSRSKFSKTNEVKKTLFSFIGTLDYFPNVEAIKFLGKDFFPKLSSEVKECFVVAGRRPSPVVEEVCRDSNIRLRIDLSEEEINDLYLNTRILVVPLEHGSGTRLKIIEGVLAGCQVLSTAIGREGIKGSAITEANLNDFFSEFEKLRSSGQASSLSVDEGFLSQYELGSWSKINKEGFLRFLEQKVVQ